MIEELKNRFQIKRCIWVSDAGLLTEENLKVLKGSGYPFILGMGGEVQKDAKNAIEQTKELEQKEFKDAKFWDVVVAHATKKKGQGQKSTETEGEASEDTQLRRVVVVESEGRQKKTAAIFERRLEKVRQEFQALDKKVKQGKCVQKHDIEVEPEKIPRHCRVKKCFSHQADNKVFVWQEHTTAVEARKSNAGKYALMTNTDLPADQVLSAYRTLLAAEDAFLVLKDILDLRPVWHKCDVNVEGHVLLAVWSYLLYKTLEIRMEQKGIDFTAPRALNAIKAVQVATRDKAVWKLLKVPPQAIQAFEAVGVDDVNGHFKKWAANAPAYHYSPRLDPEYGRAP